MAEAKVLMCRRGDRASRPARMAFAGVALPVLVDRAFECVDVYASSGIVGWSSEIPAATKYAHEES